MGVFNSNSDDNRSESTGLHQYLCMCISSVRGWFDYQIKCDSSSVLRVGVFSIWLTEVIIVTYRFL